MRLPPIKLPRWFFHRHYEWWLVGLVLAVWTIIFLINYFGAGR